MYGWAVVDRTTSAKNSYSCAITGLILCLTVVVFILLSTSVTPAAALEDVGNPIDPQMKQLKKEMTIVVKDMINHAFDGYMNHAFPKDELSPISCTGVDTLGSYALTLIDSLDVLAMVGRHAEFRRLSKWVQENIRFDRDINVSVFETNIRIVGGLIAAHFMYEENVVAIDPEVDDYDGGLLQMAIDLTDRLLPAFESETDIPFGTVNLKKGVPKGEIDITATASGGTFLMEMVILTSVTGNSKYERAARRAARALFNFRSDKGLVGNHINITSGKWTLDYGSVGTGIDSFLEYLLKTHLMTGDLEFWMMFKTLHTGFTRYSRKGPWYLDVNIHNGGIVSPLHNSLASFFPGTLTLAGDLPEAKEATAAIHTIWKRYGAIPEGHNVNIGMPQHNQLRYPLRPEHAESLYMLYRSTHDPTYLEMGAEFVRALNTRTRTKCGFAVLEDVNLQTDDWLYADRMESFVLSETLKYLLLLFDDENPLGDTRNWVFNTEGHPYPLSDEWNLDEWYDAKKHKASAGVPENGHPLSSMTPEEYKCPHFPLGRTESKLYASLLLWPFKTGSSHAEGFA